MFDVGGRLILQDNFSGALDAVVAGSERAEQALRELGTAGDASGKQAKARIAELTRELDVLKAKAKSGGGLTVVDVSRFQEASGELRNLKSGLDEVQGATRGASSAMELFGKVSLATGAAFGAMRIANTAMELTKLGAQAQTMAQIFGNLSESVGVDGQALLTEMKRVSRGTVDEMTLMTTANRALLAGGADLAGKVPQLFEIARAASLATGQDINYVFETLVKGINKASPLLIDNADIYIRVGSAVDEWAAKQGKVADELSLTERRMAIANAVIDQGSAFIAKMGVASETAADKMQSLPVALKEIEIALGGLAVQVGVADIIGQMAKDLQATQADFELTQQIKNLREQIKALGDEDLLARFDAQLERIRRERTIAFLFSAEYDDTEFTKAREEALRAFTEEAKKASGVHGSMWDDAKIKQAATSTEEATLALQAYNAALSQVASNTTSLSGLATQLGQVAGAVKALSLGAPELPQIGAELFSADVVALREWVGEITALNPELAQAGAQTLTFIAGLEQEQQALLSTATATDSSRQSLLSLAEATLGAGSSIIDLATNFDKLPEAVQRAINPVKLLDMAIADLRRQAGAPITLDVSIAGLQTSLDSIDSMALRLAGVLSPEKVRAFREKARADATDHWRQMGVIDEFGMQLEQKVLLKGYEDIVTGTLDSYKRMETGARQAATNMAGSASELAGKIKTALGAGLDVTSLDFALADAGQYEDKALESARRLAAVAARGFAEIEAHPDWAMLLEIPPDVLAGSEAGLKAWAAQTQSAVQDLARPDLINWDAFIESFRAGLDREAAQDLTIDIAVDKLNAAGLLSGSEEERRQQVAEALGISEPKLTIDALFQVAEEPAVARQNLLDQFLGDMGALQVPAALTGLDAAAVAKGIDMNTVQTELENQGQKGIFHLMQGAINQLEDTAIATKVAGSWLSDFTENWEAFTNIGTWAGDTTFSAFYKAMESNIGGVRRRIAELILPEVISSLGGARSGALP